MNHVLRFLLILALATAVGHADQSPAYRWLSTVGGSNNEGGASVATDAAGNSYVTGFFASASISFGPYTLQNTSNGTNDIYLVKYDPRGNVVWARSYGGASSDNVTNIALDPSGNIFLAGYYWSNPLAFVATYLSNASGGVSTADGFLVKLDPAGNPLWARSAGGALGDYGHALAVDSSGNSYFGGYFNSASLTFGATTLNNANAGQQDIFLVKYDPSGTVQWARRAGGTSYEYLMGLAVDRAGNTTIGGLFASTSITFGATVLTNAGSENAFLAHYDSSGNPLWALRFGSTVWEGVDAVAASSSGTITVTGHFYSPSVTIGATTLTNAGPGANDIFLARIDKFGNVLWATGAGGPGFDYGVALALDGAGNTYLGGYFGSASITFGTTSLVNSGSYDGLVAKYDAAGNAVWAKAIAGPSTEQLMGIAVDPASNCIVTGSYYSSPVFFGNLYAYSNGNSDAFAARIDGNPPSLASADDVAHDQGGKVLLKWSAAAIDCFAEYATGYSIWRALPAGQIPPAMSDDQTTMASGGKIYRRMAVNGVNYYWENVGTQPAHLLPQYSFAAPTLSDSMSPSADGKEYFFVSAQTGDPNVFYDSNVDSGYSIDNIPPVAPAGLAATAQPGPQAALTWNSPTDLDVGSYDIYRSTSSGFSPSPGTKIGTSSGTSYTDASVVNGTAYFYRLIATDVHGNRSQPSAQASALFSITQSFAMGNSWNMVSVPLFVSDFSRAALYPTAISEAFAYQGSYVISSTLKNGAGYWLRFNGTQNVPITGTLLNADTIDVSDGWNMVGSVSASIPTSSVTSIPGGLVTSPFFGYNNGYTPAATIVPGSGYWVKVSGAGKLVLNAGPSSSGTRIRITPTAELPPPPPDGSSGETPKTFALSQNYPNPFNPSTVITYSLPAESRVRLAVYNMLGQEVMLLVDDLEGAGTRSVTVNAGSLSSGIYTYRLTAGAFTDVRKMMLVK